MQGIDGVEVRVDEGLWQPMEVSTPLSDGSWVQWRGDVEATGGVQYLEVRAIGSDGEVQTDVRVSAHPDGATGHHRRRIRVV